jgi:MYXO-CTERM domain-containing protein
MRLSTVVFSLLLVVAGVGVARADVAPPDACTAPGQPCQNAGPAPYKQAGTCVAATCYRSVPNADGGRTSMSYDCSLCQAGGAGGNGGSAAGGTGGASATGGDGGGATGGGSGTGGATATGGSGPSTGTGGSSVHTGGGSSGCAVAPGQPDDDASALALLAVIGLAIVLRRRHASA